MIHHLNQAGGPRPLGRGGIPYDSYQNIYIPTGQICLYYDANSQSQIRYND